MLSEYAVEPSAIGANWRVFKDLIDRFGIDKGRLISRQPNRWEKKVIQAAKEAGVPDVRMKSIVERLRNAKHKVVDFNRTYDSDSDWMGNALRGHAERPYRAIICGSDSNKCTEAVHPDDCSDDHPLFEASISQDVSRTADLISNSLLSIAMVAKEIDYVDPFFDLRATRGDYIGPLSALLTKLEATGVTPKIIRVHFRSHESRPPPNLLLRDGLRQTAGMIPQGYIVELFEWSEIEGGEDMHDRFFLTDVGGVMIGAGLSATGTEETATFTLLNFGHSQSLRNRFSAGSTVYTKAGDSVRFFADGTGEIF